MMQEDSYSCSRRAFLKTTDPASMAALAAWPAASLAAAVGQQPSSGSDSAGATGSDAANRVKLLFSGPQDVTDTWGRLQFGATPMQNIRD